VDVNVEISENIAHIKITQEYENPSRNEPQDAADEEEKGDPISINFKFPKENDTIISRMAITVDENVIEAKIEKEGDGLDQYNNALAEG
jgi:hypothetical protein